MATKTQPAPASEFRPSWLRAEKLDRFRLSAKDPVRDTLALVLAGGSGKRLLPLTRWRCKPAIPFAGKFRIIDFTLSNCINSGIRHIGVLTQYKSHTLIKHLQKGWNFFNGEFNEFIELLPAQQQLGENWYAGTADAVYQNLETIESHAPDYVLILGGDHVYKADYRRMIQYHIDSAADMTIGCVEVPVSTGSEFGVVNVNNSGRVISFVEKPAVAASIPGRSDTALASMGIYIFSKKYLCDLLKRDAAEKKSTHDFGKDIIPRCIKADRVVAYPFFRAQKDHYWKDVGTLDAYYEANMGLVDVCPEMNLYESNWPIWSYQPQLPPAKFVFDEDQRLGVASNSLVASGCIVSGAKIRESILFSGVRVEESTNISASLLLPDVVVGKDCVIQNAIIEEGCHVPNGTRIGLDLQYDNKRFHMTAKGIVVVCADMLKEYETCSA